MSRKAHEPDEKSRQIVQGMIGCGMSAEDTATVVGIDRKTLYKHYRPEIDTGHLRANATVANALFKKATGGNVVAQIFWLKARAGWKDKMEVEHSGEIEHLTGTTREIIDPATENPDA